MASFMEVQRIHFHTIGSTNTWAKQHLDELDPDQLTLIRSDIQTEGRGRFGRPWISPEGNLHLTIVFSIKDHTERVPNLGQILALTTSRVLEHRGISPEIKWPNDLLVKGKKCAGILVEVVGPMALLGIGIDVYVPVETDQETIALCQLTDFPWDLGDLADALGAGVIQDWKRDFTEVKESLEERLAFKGQSISLITHHGPVEGVVVGLSPRGELLLKTSTGTITPFASGDIQNVRKL